MLCDHSGKMEVTLLVSTCSFPMSRRKGTDLGAASSSRHRLCFCKHNFKFVAFFLRNAPPFPSHQAASLPPSLPTSAFLPSSHNNRSTLRLLINRFEVFIRTGKLVISLLLVSSFGFQQSHPRFATTYSNIYRSRRGC